MDCGAKVDRGEDDVKDLAEAGAGLEGKEHLKHGWLDDDVFVRGGSAVDPGVVSGFCGRIPFNRVDGEEAREEIRAEGGEGNVVGEHVVSLLDESKELV